MLNCLEMSFNHIIQLQLSQIVSILLLVGIVHWSTFSSRPTQNVQNDQGQSLFSPRTLFRWIQVLIDFLFKSKLITKDETYIKTKHMSIWRIFKLWDVYCTKRAANEYQKEVPNVWYTAFIKHRIVYFSVILIEELPFVQCWRNWADIRKWSLSSISGW